MKSTKKPRANQAQQTALVAARVPADLRAEVDAAAEKAGGMSAVVRVALANHLGRPDLAAAGKEPV